MWAINRKNALNVLRIYVNSISIPYIINHRHVRTIDMFEYKCVSIPAFNCNFTGTPSPTFLEDWQSKQSSYFYKGFPPCPFPLSFSRSRIRKYSTNSHLSRHASYPIRAQVRLIVSPSSHSRTARFIGRRVFFCRRYRIWRWRKRRRVWACRISRTSWRTILAVPCTAATRCCRRRTCHHWAHLRPAVTTA